MRTCASTGSGSPGRGRGQPMGAVGRPGGGARAGQSRGTLARRYAPSLSLARALHLARSRSLPPARRTPPAATPTASERRRRCRQGPGRVTRYCGRRAIGGPEMNFSAPSPLLRLSCSSCDTFPTSHSS
jgi:hypothetical protein